MELGMNGTEGTQHQTNATSIKKDQRKAPSHDDWLQKLEEYAVTGRGGVGGGTHDRGPSMLPDRLTPALVLVACSMTRSTLEQNASLGSAHKVSTAPRSVRHATSRRSAAQPRVTARSVSSGSGTVSNPATAATSGAPSATPPQLAGTPQAPHDAASPRISAHALHSRTTNGGVGRGAAGLARGSNDTRARAKAIAAGGGGGNTVHGRPSRPRPRVRSAHARTRGRGRAKHVSPRDGGGSGGGSNAGRSPVRRSNVKRRDDRAAAVYGVSAVDVAMASEARGRRGGRGGGA